jgi:formyltetrahydrofolate-dependent phosphoribosylglycinamide formyltransferase
MFSRLQQKWKVSAWQLFLILGTFALGGSLCGFATRQLLQLVPVSNAFLYGTLYFIVLTLLWPISVLLISIPMGQFRFFSNYLRKMGSKLGLTPSGEKYPARRKIAVFASGSGSNARKIMEHFHQHPAISVALLVCNKPNAGALHHAAEFGISTLLIERKRFENGDHYLPELETAGIDFIVLAGFLWKIPDELVNAFPGKMVNIHPALLPKFGGKGMYGHHVHEAVIAAGEVESGITIHFVDNQYDHGAVIFQAMCEVEPGDTADSLAARVLQLEHRHYARTIEQVITSAE